MMIFFGSIRKKKGEKKGKRRGKYEGREGGIDKEYSRES